MVASLRFWVILTALFLGAAPAHSTGENGCFDTEKLRFLESPALPTLIYVWSERMVYSVQQKSVARAVAEQLGLQFLAVHEAQLKCSPVWAQREALRHFPSAFVARERGVHPHPIVGAMPPRAWEMSILQRLDAR